LTEFTLSDRRSDDPPLRGPLSGSTPATSLRATHQPRRYSVSAVFDLEVSGWSVVVRTVIVYFALLLGLRLAGKREIGQITPFDLVIILLIANAVQNAMVGPDTSVTAGLIAAAVLIAVNYAVAFAGQRIAVLRRATEGTPTLLINDGEFVIPNMRREAIDQEEVMAAMREHGIDRLEDVRTAVLEIDGSISIVPNSSNAIRTQKHERFIKKH
jgi:uncharacterized membrane protein YcaP (DUF421 family)